MKVGKKKKGSSLLASSGPLPGAFFLRQRLLWRRRPRAPLALSLDHKGARRRRALASPAQQQSQQQPRALAGGSPRPRLGPAAGNTEAAGSSRQEVRATEEGWAAAALVAMATAMVGWAALLAVVAARAMDTPCAGT